MNNVKKENQSPVEVREGQVRAKATEDQTEANGDQERVFKRPDKIIPCPRCNSLETKFCYFNNYNVNQPRHFCKNCQRYWTAGGTMRNVPVGAGRRKNKHFASQFRQIIVSPDGVPISALESPNSSTTHQIISCGDSGTTFRPASVGNGMVLKFGPEAPLCESMETLLNLGDQKRLIDVGGTGENREESTSSGSSMTASGVQGNEVSENMVNKERVVVQGSSNEVNTTSNPVQCFQVPPWSVPWHPGWNGVNSMAAAPQYPADRLVVPNNSNGNPVQWCPTPVLAVPGFCAPNIPVQFIPASYWSCMNLWATGAANMPLAGPNSCLSPSSSTSNNSCCSGNGSPTLGKHSREPNSLEEEQLEQCVLVPKTLRIDDPYEASKSPIWTTLGIKHNQKDSMSKCPEIEKEGKHHVPDGTHILEANPAALSRSHTFQEST